MTTWTNLPEGSIDPVDIGDHPGKTTGNINRTYQVSKALNGTLGADLADRVRYVGPDGSNSSSGRKMHSAMRHLEAAAESLPDDGYGGLIIGVPGDYEHAEIDLPNLVIEGLGSAGADRQTGLGGMRIIDSGSGTALKLGVGLSSESFQGPNVRNVCLVGDEFGTSEVGLESGKFSNFRYENVTAANFTNGKGFLISGSDASQYGILRDCNDFECLIGIEADNHNGLLVTGGTSEYLTDDVTIPDGSVGVVGGTDADTMRVRDRVIQFKGIGADFSGQNSSIGGTRFEAVGNGVTFRSQFGSLLPGCTFNNSIVGGGGKTVVVTDTAEYTWIARHAYGSFDADPVIDNGLRTYRGDGITIVHMLPNISAIGNHWIHRIPTHSHGLAAWYARYAELNIGENAVAASGSHAYGFHFSRVHGGSVSDLGPDLNTVGGVGAFGVVEFDISAGPGDNALNAQDAVRFDVNVLGSPTTLVGASVSLVLVPF